MRQNLTSGNHSLELIGISDGVEVDNLLLLPDNTCVPTGFGDNCTTGQTNAPPTTSITSPTNNQEVYGNNTSIVTTATANNGGSINSSTLSVNSNLVQTITTPPYNFDINTLSYKDGSITISVSSTDNENNSTSASATVYVSNGDLDHSGAVNISDLAIMANNWGKANQTYEEGNITGAVGSNSVNLSDLAILASNWGWIL